MTTPSSDLPLPDEHPDNAGEPFPTRRPQCTLTAIATHVRVRLYRDKRSGGTKVHRHKHVVCRCDCGSTRRVLVPLGKWLDNFGSRCCGKCRRAALSAADHSAFTAAKAERDTESSRRVAILDHPGVALDPKAARRRFAS